MDGRRHGHWILRTPTRNLDGRFWIEIGGLAEASFVDGEFHGRWVRRWADGDVTYECYSNDDDC